MKRQERRRKNHNHTPAKDWAISSGGNKNKITLNCHSLLTFLCVESALLKVSSNTTFIFLSSMPNTTFLVDPCNSWIPWLLKIICILTINTYNAFMVIWRYTHVQRSEKCESPNMHFPRKDLTKRWSAFRQHLSYYKQVSSCGLCVFQFFFPF